ncbi:MAG: type II toxin-antitoxin system prevent-host-death family antitoxin [Planctomycetota bacterium]
MDSFNIHEAKTQFSRILAKVQAGEEVIIAKAGEPIARIVPIRSQRLRIPETEKGTLWVAEDFGAPLSPDLLDEFEGRS